MTPYLSPLSLLISNSVLPLWTRRLPPLAPLSNIIAGDPRFEQLVGDGKNHRADEKPDDAEGDEAPQHPGKDQKQRQIDAFADEDRAQNVVNAADNDRPHEKHGPPDRIPLPIQPDHRRPHDQEGGQLRQGEDKYDCRQQCR